MGYKLFIVEDHPVMRSAYTRLINHQPNFETCGEAESANQALAMIPQVHPDLVLVDISLPGMSGIELVKQLKLNAPTLPTLVISGHTDVLYAKNALQAGAKGYLDKAGLAEVLVEAIYQVLQGRVYVSEDIQSKLQHYYA